MIFTANLADLDQTSIAQFGNKAINLYQMIRANFQVPAGFVIHTSAFEQWVLSDKKKLSQELKTQIFQAFDQLNAKYVAVRSSATSEDSKNASWAGQFDSVLFVERANLIEAIEKCWQGAFNARSQAYGKDQGKIGNKNSMALVIQTMIDGEVSGVGFSIHPVTNNTDQIVIEAVEGTGEKLVSGKVTPDQFIVDKNTDAIGIQSDVNKTLTEKEVLEIAAIIKKLEQYFGYPVDIEWTKGQNKVYILQARPITKQEKLSTHY